MSMDLNNIERNQLDYILTDVSPTELSDRFTYRYFYEYLNTKSSDLSKIIKDITKLKNDNKEVFRQHKNWVSIPLNYTIMKQLQTERTISLLQPLAAMQLYLFICAYQKEMLAVSQKNSVYSLRYHKKNNDLYYKNKNKSIIKYFGDISNNAGKEIIEQTGMYFNIGPYKSIAAFTTSEEWLRLNLKYSYFAKVDYKSCFDSIYTHTFSWIIGKDVNDTKKFKNGSIYCSIDRILMNINARTSNGIVVGPEFSRMVAEILLQTIDNEVFSILFNKSIRINEQYNVFRFVDDIFIFADSEALTNEIVSLYSNVARKYLLNLNEEKLSKKKIPFVLDEWLNETNLFTNRASSLIFHSGEELKSYAQEQDNIGAERNKPYLLKASALFRSKRTIMNQFNELICKHKDKTKTIVSYFLGMILNKVGSNKESFSVFKKDVSEKTVFNFIELSFYIYSFFPDFNNTQKIQAIISYIKDEYNIFDNKENLQLLFNQYAFVFDKANLNDTINLILLCRQAKISLPFHQEERIVDQLVVKDDPILWASYLLYSRYSDKYYRTIRDKIGSILIERIDSIVVKKSVYTYREFWWVILFNKCPHLTAEEQQKIDSLISEMNEISADGQENPGEKLGDLFVRFLTNNSKQFFEWEIDQEDFLRNMTFKTRQRSIFKNYRENLLSLNWGSI